MRNWGTWLSSAFGPSTVLSIVLNNGKLNMNGSYSLCKVDEVRPNQKFSALYTFQGLKKVPVDEVESGDIIAFAGVDDISIGDTMSDNESPDPLPRIQVDEP